MATGGYWGVGSLSRKGGPYYWGVDGLSRKVKKMYFGDAAGTARLCYQDIPNVQISFSQTGEAQNPLVFYKYPKLVQLNIAYDNSGSMSSYVLSFSLSVLFGVLPAGTPIKLTIKNPTGMQRTSTAAFMLGEDIVNAYPGTTTVTNVDDTLTGAADRMLLSYSYTIPRRQASAISGAWQISVLKIGDMDLLGDAFIPIWQAAGAKIENVQPGYG